MDTCTPKRPRRHHILPCFYLKGFQHTKLRSNQILVLHKPLGRISAQSVYKSFVERDYYSLSKGTPNTTIIEEALAKAESRFALAVKKVINDPDNLEQQEKVSLVCLAAHLAVQNRRTRLLMEAMLTRKAVSIAEQDVNIKDTTIIHTARGALWLREKFWEMPWEIIGAPGTDLVAVTSDSAVIFCPFLGGPNLKQPRGLASTILFPLSAELLLVGNSGIDFSTLLNRHYFFAMNNTLQLIHARRQIALPADAVPTLTDDLQLCRTDFHDNFHFKYKDTLSALALG